MARKLRVQFEGAIYHVTLRGVERRDLFADDWDLKRFLAQMSRGVELDGVRLYLFCLMRNHVHLLIETPMGNLSSFMHRLQTAYTVYFNLRHRRCGHLVQGRYGAVLVEGDDYLLKLSRYIHLNPVCVGGIEEKSLKERLGRLHRYAWSSYRGYVGKAKPAAFVEYEPLLMLAGGDGEAGRRRTYRRFVDAGVAKTDEEFQAVLKAEKWGIGSEGFCNWVQDRHLELMRTHRSKEDVAFRKVGRWLGAEEILGHIAKACKVGRAFLEKRQEGDLTRPLAAKMLGKYGGKTQREVAKLIGLTTGAAVSLQQKRLKLMLAQDIGLRDQVAQIEKNLAARQADLVCGNEDLCFKG